MAVQYRYKDNKYLKDLEKKGINMDNHFGEEKFMKLLEQCSVICTLIFIGEGDKKWANFDQDRHFSVVHVNS